MSDRECKRTWGKALGNDGEHFKDSTMLCAIDPDGRAPLSSGCNGDSGAPLYTGPNTAPRILGVVSYGGLKCGADHLPSVFAEVRPLPQLPARPGGAPAIAPVAGGASKITGKRSYKVSRRDRGKRILCLVEGSNAGGPALAPPDGVAVPR